jgi:hypothetical protein
MASSTRTAEREEERRHNLRTLVIASVASATAAAVTSQLWIHGTWVAAALTPALVALISEAMHRPTERIARAWTTERPALGTDAARQGERRAPKEAPLPDAPGAGPVRVYRQPTARAPRRRIALGAVAATAALAFGIAVVAITAGDLVSGGSIGQGSGRTTLWGGGSSQEQEQEPAPEQRDAPAQSESTPGEAPPATTEPAPEEPPSDTPTTPLPETPPGEPAPDTAPTP